MNPTCVPFGTTSRQRPGRGSRTAARQLFGAIALEPDLEAVVRDVRLRDRRVAGHGPDDVVPVLAGRDRDQPQPVVRRHDIVGADVDGERVADAWCRSATLTTMRPFANAPDGDQRDAQAEDDDPHAPSTLLPAREVRGRRRSAPGRRMISFVNPARR